MFKRWNVKGLAATAMGLQGEYMGLNGQWTLGVYRDEGATMAVTGTATLSSCASDGYTYISQDGIIVEAGVEQMGANIGLELDGVRVTCSPTESREVNA
jgi:hypothetical protein